MEGLEDTRLVSVRRSFHGAATTRSALFWCRMEKVVARLKDGLRPCVLALPGEVEAGVCFSSTCGWGWSGVRVGVEAE